MWVEKNYEHGNQACESHRWMTRRLRELNAATSEPEKIMSKFFFARDLREALQSVTN